MDLFDYMREKTQEQESPLASRMRPQMLEEVVGQQHIMGKTSFCIVRSRRISWDRSFFTDLRERERRLLQR